MSERIVRVADIVVRTAVSAAVAVSPVAPALAQSAPLPSGGQVVSGQASIGAPSANAMIVNQSSQRAIVNWSSFSVGSGNSVTFQQPGASSAILNRVTGNTPSSIGGQINANGQVFLVNPNGIAITPSGQVRTDGGFVASTLGISNSDFNSGRLKFSGDGASAAVVNQGRIVTAPGSFVGLLGGTVSNEGHIAVPMGRVGLGSGEQATLDIHGDGFLQVAVPTAARSRNGKALVDQSGKISAKGGIVELKAANVREAIRDTVNVSGTVAARSVSGRNGAIVLSGGEGGRVNVSGKLSTAGKSRKPGTRPDLDAGRIAISGGEVAINGQLDASGKTGGLIDVSGETVTLAGATLVSRGAARGGLVRIGGAFQGGRVTASAADVLLFSGRFGDTAPIRSADKTTIDEATRIDVSASGESGVAGTAIVWSEITTDMRGTIDARGATSAGAVEISSKRALLIADLGSLHLGAGGKLLLDPADILVTNGSDPAGSYDYADAPAALNLDANALANLVHVQGIDVTLQASNDISWFGNFGSFAPGTTLAANFGTLRLEAGRSISVAGLFSMRHASQDATTDGSVFISANAAGATGTRAVGEASIDLSDAAFDLGRGSLTVTMGPDKIDGQGGNIAMGSVLSAAGVSVTNHGSADFASIELYEPLSNVGAVSLANLGGAIEGKVRLIRSITNAGTISVTNVGAPGTGWIGIYNDTTTSGDQTYTGNIRAFPYTYIGTTLNATGGNVTWADQATSTITSGAGEGLTFKMISSGVLTGYGELARTVAGVTITDATRLGIGYDTTNGTAFTRTYGDGLAAITPQIVPGIVLVRGAMHGTDSIAGITLSSDLSVTDPGLTAPVGLRNALISANPDFSLTTTNRGYFVDLKTVQVPTTITPRALTYSVNDAQYAYGSPQSIVTLGNMVPNDAIAPIVQVAGNPVTLEPVAGGAFSFAHKRPAGTYGFDFTGLTGEAAANYTLTMAGNTAGIATVDRKVLGYLNPCCDASFVYGSTVPGITLALDGVLPGDNVSITGLGGTTVFSGISPSNTVALDSRMPAGNYRVVATGISGADAANYALPTDVINNSTLTVAQREIAANFDWVPTHYGEGPGSVTLIGALAGDDVTGIQLATPQSGGAQQAFTAYTPIGDYRFDPGLQGQAAGNYVLSPFSAWANRTINPRAINVTVAGASVVYGSGLTPSASIDGVLPGDVVTATIGVFDGVTNLGATLPAIANVGNYLAQPTGIAGTSASNYFMSVAGSTGGTIAVVPKPVTYSVDGTSGIYGNAIATPSLLALAGIMVWDQGTIGAAVGVTNGQGQEVTPGPLLGAGIYDARVTALTTSGAPGTLANYALNHVDSTAGHVTISKRPLTFSLANINGIYGSDITLVDAGASANGQFAGFVNGETAVPVASVLTSVPGVGVSSPTPAHTMLNAGSPAGNYRYTVSATAAGSGGFDLNNYALQGNIADVIVAPKLLTYALGTAHTTYGGPHMAPVAVLSGVFGSDQVTGGVLVSVGGLQYTATTLPADTPASSYGTSVNVLSGTAAANYVLSGSGNTPGTLVVQPKALTWSVTDVSTTYGTVATPGAAQFTGILPGDSVGGVVSVLDSSTPIMLAANTPVGTYNQAVSGLTGSAAANYTLDGGGTPGALVVNPMPLTLQVASASKQYGEAVPAIGYSIAQGTPLIADNVGLSTLAHAGDLSSVGTYATTGSATGNTSNYHISVVPGTLTVFPLDVSYTVISPQGSVYDNPIGPSTATFTPANASVNAAAFQPGYTTEMRDQADNLIAPGFRVPAGTYVVSPVVSNPNYRVVGGQNGALTVDRRVIAATVLEVASSAYGSAPAANLFYGVLAGDTVTARITDFTNNSANVATADIWAANGTLISPNLAPQVGTYDVVGIALGGASAANYAFENAGLTAGNRLMRVVPKEITIANFGTTQMTYGESPTAYFNGTVTFNGLVDPAHAGILSPLMRSPGVRPDAGAHTWRAETGVSPGGRDVAGNGVACSAGTCLGRNYVIAATGNADAALTVMPKLITGRLLGGNTSSATYGDPAIVRVSLDGLLLGDAASVTPVVRFSDVAAGQLLGGTSHFGVDATNSALQLYAGQYDRVPVLAQSGNLSAGRGYSVAVAALSGASAGNYVLVAPGAPGELTITPRPLTYETPGPLTYYAGVGAIGPSLNGLGSYSLSGVLTGDQVTASGIEARRLTPQPGAEPLVAAGGLPVQSLSGIGIGDYALVVSGLGGAHGTNYKIATVGNAPGTLSVISSDAFVSALTLLGTNIQTAILNGQASRPAGVDPAAALPQPQQNDGGVGAPPKAGASTSISQQTGVEGSLGDMSGSANAGQSVSASANATILGVNARAGVEQHAGATGCVGSVCLSASANTTAGATASITPIGLSVKGTVGGTVAISGSVSFSCGGQPCTLSNTLSATTVGKSDLSVGLTGVSMVASVEASVTNDVKIDTDCGGADCSATLGVTAGVVAGISNSNKISNGVEMSNGAEFGAMVGVHGAYEVSSGGFGAGVGGGVTTGNFAIHSTFGATMDDGTFKLNVGGTLAVGIIGVDYDLKVDINVNRVAQAFTGTSHTVLVFADPDAAQVRRDAEVQFRAEVTRLQEAQLSFARRLMQGTMTAEQIKATSEVLRKGGERLSDRAHQQKFSTEVDANGRVKITDLDPPKRIELTISEDGEVGKAVLAVANLF